MLCMSLYYSGRLSSFRSPLKALLFSLFPVALPLLFLLSCVGSLVSALSLLLYMHNTAHKVTFFASFTSYNREKT